MTTAKEAQWREWQAAFEWLMLNGWFFIGYPDPMKSRSGWWAKAGIEPAGPARDWKETGVKLYRQNVAAAMPQRRMNRE